MTWWGYALLSALFAAATAILTKVGVQGLPSTLATAIRTLVVLIFAWSVALTRGEHHALSGNLNRKSVILLLLSGLATGASWLAYFRALQLGPASRVAAVDKLSLALTVTLAIVLLGEELTWKLAVGVTLMVAGALLTIA